MSRSPLSLRSLYLAADGTFRANGEWWVVWPLSRLVDENLTAWHDGTLEGSLLAFGDDGAGDLTEIQRWRYPTQPYAVIGRQLLIGDNQQFTLIDTERSSTRTVAVPPAHGHPSYGLVSPDGRSVAIEYRDPYQVMDLWLLDIQSMQWTHMPSMPVRAFIKRPAPTWTSDGRLAVVGDFDAEPNRRHLLIVWRPGEISLELREVTNDASFIA